MDPASIPTLHQHIGTARLRPYLDRYNGNQQLAVRLHAWNAELATAFWGPIGILEVALRNTIHRALGQGGNPDWWNHVSQVALAPNEAHSITQTLSKLARSNNFSPTADDVVAASSLGLWAGLLDVGIARDPRFDYETRLWVPRLQYAFPHRGTLQRRRIHAHLNRVRIFRNRIAHHEPIYNKRPAEIRDSILWCLQLIDPALHQYVDQAHRIDEVLTRQAAAVTNGECSL